MARRRDRARTAAWSRRIGLLGPGLRQRHCGVLRVDGAGDLFRRRRWGGGQRAAQSGCAGPGAGAGAAAGWGGCRTGAKTGAGCAAASTGCGAAGGRGGSAVTGENGCSIVVGTARAVFSTRLIEPVMSSTLFSSAAIRASSRSRSAVSTRTVSASLRPSTASSGRAGLMPDGMTTSRSCSAACQARSDPASVEPAKIASVSDTAATRPHTNIRRKSRIRNVRCCSAINAPIALSATLLTAFRVVGNRPCPNHFVESISRIRSGGTSPEFSMAAGAFFRSTARI